MKRIKVIELGGTISARGKNRLDFKDYTSGVYTGEDFQKALPELERLADVSFESFLQVSSTKMTSIHWIQLREKVIHALEKENFDGIVITHGTSTLEETAYFLHLSVPSLKPIVFVGAQRPFTALGSDAPINLLQAIQVAIHEESYGKGVLVVANDIISSARDVSKTDTYRLETFQSGYFGCLGVIDPDKQVQYFRTPTRKHTKHSAFSSLTISSLPMVEIVYSYAGATGHLIEHIVNSGEYSGIITAGTGAGLVSPSELEALNKAVEQGMWIVRSSRVGNGRVVPMERYKEFSLISGDNLSPQKARILLMLSVLMYRSFEEVQDAFYTY